MIPFPITDIVPSLGGQKNITMARGLPVSLFPVIGGEIFSEIEAIETLATVDVYPIGAGGVYQGAGATIFEISGPEAEINKVLEVYEAIKDTEPLKINLKPH